MFCYHTEKQEGCFFITKAVQLYKIVFYIGIVYATLSADTTS